MHTEKVVPIKTNERLCKLCKKTKALSEFHFHNGNQIYMHQCQECFSEKERARQNKLWENPEYRERHNKKGQEHRKKTNWKDKRTLKDRVHYRYGVSWEHIVQTLANQFGRCANIGCGKEISLDVKGTAKNRAVIDHCHKTGKFRALLCGGCNVMLGVLESESDKVLGLMDYLNKHKPTG